MFTKYFEQIVAALEIKVGDTFSSLEELKDKIDEYSAVTFTQLWIRDARTIEAAAKRVPKRAASMKAELKYAEVVYCCIHGGKQFKKRGNAIRNTTYVY